MGTKDPKNKRYKKDNIIHNKKQQPRSIKRPYGMNIHTNFHNYVSKGYLCVSKLNNYLSIIIFGHVGPSIARTPNQLQRRPHSDYPMCTFRRASIED